MFNIRSVLGLYLEANSSHLLATKHLLCLGSVVSTRHATSQGQKMVVRTVESGASLGLNSDFTTYWLCDIGQKH